MSLIGAGALTLVVGSLAATLAFQFRPISSRFPTLDRLGILPRWKFFTQRNGTYDVEIRIQDRSAVGVLSDWASVPIVTARRPWSILWRPEMLRMGLLWRAIETVELRAARAAALGPDTSRAYATILNHCRDMPPRHGVFEARRFALIRISGSSEAGYQVTYMSDFHRF